MRLRITEINEDAVAHILRHKPAEATHGLGDALLIGRNDLAQVLRVHAGRECRRADEVREHHRDLTAFSSVVRLRSNWSHDSGLRCTFVAVIQFGYRAQQLATITEYDTEVFQVLIGQVAKD